MWLNLWNDIRLSARSLKRSPGFAAAAIATIALGAGLNSGIFTVINGILFRGLPAPAASELISVYQELEGVPNREGAFRGGLFSTEEYRTYRDRSVTFSGLIGHSDPTRATLGGESPQETLGLLVTCNYFDALRQQPVMGRALTSEDCETGADPVVVLGYDVWTTVFAADPTVLGRTIELNRQLLTVVGVAAKGTYGGFVYDATFFAPISAQPLLLPNENSYANEQNSWLFLMGRRKPDVSLEQVRAELGVISAQIDQQQPGRSTTLRVERATPISIPQFRQIALAAGAVVMTAFSFVLLIACANVANLLLARATGRTREIAIRLALGSSRARVVQQLVVESMLIATAGGALGSILALWSFQALVAIALPSFSPVGVPPIVLDPSPDLRVLSFTLALTFGTGILFGLAPAMRASKPDLHRVMKEDSAGGGGSHRGGRLQGTLVGLQVALCIALMIAAGLLSRSLYTTQTIDPGFVYENVSVAAYDLASGGYDSGEAAAFQRQLLERVSALPGVEAVAYALQEPLSSDVEPTLIRLPEDDQSRFRPASLNAVTQGYFSVVGIPIVSGRNFSEAEFANDATVAIVTETTAERYWPGREAVGQTLIWQTIDGREIAVQVVGVARDAQLTTLGEIDSYYVYMPAGLPVQTYLKLLVRSRSDLVSMTSSIQRAVWSLDPGLWVRVNALQANLDWSRNVSAIVAGLAGSLGTLALLVAMVGIYGVVSYFVARRSREIGIRMALGARSRDVLVMVLRRTMRPVAIGALIGIVVAVAASRLLSSVLFGVNPGDIFALGGAIVFVIGVALMAGVFAARQGTRADPMVALRNE